LVRVIDPPAGLRPGQRAKVKIYTDRRDNVLQSPIQSVVVRDNNHYCLIRDGQGQWRVQQVAVGPNNDSFVVIESGLSDGDQVALNPDFLWDDVAGEIPEAADEDELASLFPR
jgi:multidrug efflux pump subunit AcrA (membrane-fusion protein)